MCDGVVTIKNFGCFRFFGFGKVNQVGKFPALSTLCQSRVYAAPVLSYILFPLRLLLAEK